MSYGKATAFLPIIDLLRTYFQIETRDEAQIREKVTGSCCRWIGRSDPRSRHFSGFWMFRLRILMQRLDPPQRRQRALEGVKRLLLRGAKFNRSSSCSRTSMDRRRDAGAPGQCRGEPANRPAAAPGELPTGVPACVGRQTITGSSASILCRRSAEELLEALLGDAPCCTRSSDC